jgi:hypothetical protein
LKEQPSLESAGLDAQQQSGDFSCDTWYARAVHLELDG